MKEYICYNNYTITQTILELTFLLEFKYFINIGMLKIYSWNLRHGNNIHFSSSNILNVVIKSFKYNLYSKLGMINFCNVRFKN